ncbi:MAG: ABC transporter permease [Acidobacteriota bacterium]|jgi:putative ABC transport system permease protein
MHAIEISWTDLVIVYVLLIPAAVVLAYYRVGLLRRLSISVLRMSVQLALVGVYLQYLFRINSFWLNGAWILVMLVVANLSILNGAGLSIRRLFPATLAATTLSTVLVVAVLVGLAVRPHPVYDARYLIPLAGMLLGNCLRANIISLERFFSSLRENEREFITYLTLGASLREACLPHLRRALKTAMAPQVSTVATMGIVSLPGMMTGQILGGGSPSIAVRYQMAIVVAILAAAVIGAFLNLQAGMLLSFDHYQRLRPDVLSK